MKLFHGSVPARQVIFLALVAALGAAGCGASKAKIKGKVYYNGKLVKGGSVVYASENKSDSARIQPDGTYEFNDVPVGPVKFGVDTRSARMSPSVSGRRAYKPPKYAKTDYQPPVAAKTPADLPLIAPKYGNPETAGLPYTVTSGDQEHDITITADPNAGRQ